MALPILASLGWTAAGWLTSNAIGLSDALSSIVAPKIIDTPNAPSSNNLSTYVTNGYAFRLQILAPSDRDIQGIDDFFESYGYRVDRFALPNLKVRGSFTFVKTRDAVVYSSVKKASEQMAQMLNSGTKFWVGEIGQ